MTGNHGIPFPSLHRHFYIEEVLQKPIISAFPAETMVFPDSDAPVGFSTQCAHAYQNRDVLVNVGISWVCGIQSVSWGVHFRLVFATFAPQLAFFVDIFRQEKSAAKPYDA